MGDICTNVYNELEDHNLKAVEVLQENVCIMFD